MSSGDGEFNPPRTRVQVVNLDQGSLQAGTFDAGSMLLSFLQDEQIEEVMEFTTVEDEDTARQAVQTGEADIALIIPANFTGAALTSAESAEVILYQDPTLTIGPGILDDLLTHFLDGFSGAKIASTVAAGQLQAQDIPVDNALTAQITGAYTAWLQSSGHNAAEDGAADIRFTSPSGSETETQPAASMIGPIMSGMMIFFIFFMAANSTQSIIREHEQGTLARIFTTPTGTLRILGGKFIGVFLIVVIQAVLLLTASSLIFGIDWGQPATVALVTLGLLVVATGFGILIISFIKNTRQTGPVLGGALTLTGMLGGLFTNGIPNLPAAFDKAKLSMPQGWAMTAWERALAGASPSNVIVPVIVMLVMGIAFFAVGAVMFQRRFAR
jgi:ABC-2 type transport system permease protein